MVSAAIATAPANLKISLVRTPYFIRPDLGREPSGELWSDMLRCHAAKKQKDRDRDRERIEAAAAGPPALANDLALADGAAPANSLQAHATQSDVDAGLERFKKGMNVLPDGLAPIEFDYDVEMTSSLDAQRLLVWAGSAEAARTARGGPAARERLAEVIAREHFSKRGKLGDRRLLARCCAEAGIDAERAAKYLASGRDEDSARQQALKVHYGWGPAMGVAAYDSVPVTLFSSEGAHMEIRGSQSMAHYVEVLRQMSELPEGNRDAKASWEIMNDLCERSANWPQLEQRVFGSRDCGGLLKRPGG